MIFTQQTDWQVDVVSEVCGSVQAASCAAIGKLLLERTITIQDVVCIPISAYFAPQNSAFDAVIVEHLRGFCVGLCVVSKSMFRDVCWQKLVLVY